jgi:hypothetical protein
MFEGCPKNKMIKTVGFWKFKREKEYYGDHDLYLFSVDGGPLFHAVHARCSICRCDWMQIGKTVFFIPDQNMDKPVKLVLENRIISDNKDGSFSMIEYRKMSDKFKRKPWVSLKYLGIELNIFQKFYLFLTSFKP